MLFEELVALVNDYLINNGETMLYGYHFNSDWSDFDRWEYDIEKPDLKKLNPVKKTPIPPNPLPKRTTQLKQLNNLGSL